MSSLGEKRNVAHSSCESHARPFRLSERAQCVNSCRELTKCVTMSPLRQPFPSSDDKFCQIETARAHAAQPRHEPGRYFASVPLVRAGPHLKPPTWLPTTDIALPAASVGVSVMAALRISAGARLVLRGDGDHADAIGVHRAGVLTARRCGFAAPGTGRRQRRSGLVDLRNSARRRARGELDREAEASLHAG